MREIRYTLVSDGSSDRALMPIMEWALRRQFTRCALLADWADFRLLSRPPASLPERLRQACELYPCDLLLVHRDAESAPVEQRQEEVRSAVQESAIVMPYVPVIPVRMMEAWLLLDESAVRAAAGNPNGTMPLNIPAGSPESIANPKRVLHDALKQASGLVGRRRKRFNVTQAVHRVAELTNDFGCLHNLPAFSQFERHISAVIHSQGWNRP